MLARPTSPCQAEQVSAGKAKSATILSGTSDMYQAGSSKLLTVKTADLVEASAVQAMVKDVCLAGSNVGDLDLCLIASLLP